MATTSDHIQADIARTRARMSTTLDRATATSQGGSATLVESLTEQIRQRPIAAIGLTLLAGSLLQDYLSGSQGSSGGSAARSGGGSSPLGPSGTARQVTRNVGVGAANALEQAGDAVTDAAGAVVDTTANAASTVANTAANAASTVADTASNVAGAVVDTTSNVARQVADTTGDVVNQVVDTAGDAYYEVSETATDLVSTISQQIRQRPLLALGLSLAAGSLLQNYMSGGQGGASATTRMGASTVRTGQTAGAQAGGAVQRAGGAVTSAAGSAVDTAANVAGSVADTASGAAGSIADTATNVAGTVVDTATNAASTVADTASNVAGAVVDTTSNVARQVADTTGNVVNQVVDTAGDAYEEVSERAETLWTTLSRQAQERPLTTLGVAIAGGMLLQPTLAPRVSALTQSISAPVSTLGRSITQTVALTPPPEVDQIRETFVPVAVDRARQLTTRDLRDYLDQSLSGVVGQSSLRAGLVAAVTERAEGVVDSRLADILNRNLTGSRGLLVLSLVGAILRARSEVQQGQAQQTLTQVKTNVAQSLTQTARDQLMQFFPEFRQRFQSAQGSQQRCSNCNSVIPAGAHFCPQCGTPAPAQAPAAQAV